MRTHITAIKHQIDVITPKKKKNTNQVKLIPHALPNKHYVKKIKTFNHPKPQTTTRNHNPTTKAQQQTAKQLGRTR